MVNNETTNSKNWCSTLSTKNNEVIGRTEDEEIDNKIQHKQIISKRASQKLKRDKTLFLKIGKKILTTERMQATLSMEKIPFVGNSFVKINRGNTFNGLIIDGNA